MYSSSKWPCLFILLQLRLGSQCSEVDGASRYKTPDQQENYSFIVNICLTVDENTKMYSGVLISNNQMMSACHPFVNAADQDGLVKLPSDHFRAWVGHTEEFGQWRQVVKVHCVNTSVSNSNDFENDIAVLDVREQFELPGHVFWLSVTAMMTAEEIRSVQGSTVECEVITWTVKFKAKPDSDVDVYYLKKCPVETLKMSSCAKFLSAEVKQTSAKELTEKNLMCIMPLLTSSCLEFILPGSPVVCSKKVLGLVSRKKKPALINTFPIVMSIIRRNSFHDLRSSAGGGGTDANVLYYALMSMILNTILLQ